MLNKIGKAEVRPGDDVQTSDRMASASAFDAATTIEYSAYIFDQTKVFLRSAQARDLKFLVYLLEMVAVEAARLRDER